MNYVKYFEYILFKDYFDLCSRTLGGNILPSPKSRWHIFVYHPGTQRLKCYTEMIEKVRNGEAEHDFEILKQFHGEHSKDVPGISEYADDIAVLYHEKHKLRPEDIHKVLLGQNQWQ